MKKIAISFLFILLVFTQCQKADEFQVETIQEITDQNELIETTILSEKEAFNDPVFLEIISEIGDIEDNELKLKSSKVKSGDKIKLDYKKIKKIKKGKYESFTILIDEPDRSVKFSNLILESNGNKKNALKLDYYPTQEVIKSRKLGFKTKFSGQLQVTKLNPEEIILKSYSCIYITVYEDSDCPNPACDGSPGCIFGCDGGSTSTTYVYCFDGNSGSSSIPANPTSPPDDGYSPGSGSYTNTVDPYFNPELNAHIQYLNDLLQVEITGPADIVIDKTYIIDLQTFLQQREYVCWDMTGGVYYMCEGKWIYVRNNQHYVDLTGKGDWGKAVLGTHKLANEISSLIGTSAIAGAQFIGTYFLPVEDVYILLTGEDFDGLESNTYAAGAFLLLEVLPGGKVLKPVANILGDAAKYFFKFGDDFLDLVKVNNVVKFTDNTVLRLVEKATKNPTKIKVMLGKWDSGLPSSYVNRAGNEYTYFQFDEWDNLHELMNKNDEEIWKINKQFLDKQHSLNKSFYFSHDPNLADGFFKDEIDYLENSLGVTSFEKVGNNLWKAIW